jgi:hypothetical protein
MLMCFERERALCQVFRRLQGLSQSTAVQLEATQTQVALKSREARKCKIVHSQLAAIQKDEPAVRVFEPLGKACVVIMLARTG